MFYLHGSALELLIEGRGVEMGEECCAEAGEDHKGHVVECPTAFHAEEGLSGDREGVEELAAGTVGPRHRGEERAMRVLTFVIVCVWRGAWEGEDVAPESGMSSRLHSLHSGLGTWEDLRVAEGWVLREGWDLKLEWGFELGI